MLRESFCAKLDVIRESSELVRRYTYGYGSGTSSVGMDPYKFVTRKMTYEMEYIATELHEILCTQQQNSES